MALDEVPVDLDAEARLVVEMDVAVAHLHTLAVKSERNRIAGGVAVRFHAEAASRERRHQVRVQLGGGMRRNHDAVQC